MLNPLNDVNVRDQIPRINENLPTSSSIALDKKS